MTKSRPVPRRFEGAKEHTILVHSLSKTYAMTGWRVGYLAAPAQVIENALKAGQNSITCVAPFIQKAAAFALTDAGVQQVGDRYACCVWKTTPDGFEGCA